MVFDVMSLDEQTADPNAPKPETLDGVPESFAGPQLAHLVAHEVGHTLGLRHNFKASSLYTLDEINSDKVKGKQLASSVMDYMSTNFNVDKDQVQGDYTMVGIKNGYKHQYMKNNLQMNLGNGHFSDLSYRTKFQG